MKIMFIHKNYPAQFGRLAVWLAQHGWDVTFATARKDVKSSQLKIVQFHEHRAPSAKTHHYLIGTERAVISGQGLLRTALALEKQGYRPDVVVAHSGWGVGFFVKDIWPETKYVQYAEWYYTYPYADHTPHTHPRSWPDESAKARTRNTPFWLDFSAADATVCPTKYQATQFPEKLQHNISVLNDGFDTQTHCPAPRDTEFLEKCGIPKDAELVTYIARGMEPARGFPEVMQAIERLQKTRPKLHAVIIADDRVAYGPKPSGKSWKNHMLDTLDLDLARLHFVGLVPRPVMIKFLQATGAHLYLSSPFVLSWSFVESMACGAPIVAARSAPVEEFMIDGESGLLVNPYVTNEVVHAVEDLLEDPEYSQRLGAAARKEIVEKYDSERTIYPRHAKFYYDLVASPGINEMIAPDEIAETSQSARRRLG
ncbi:D-inositol-3-phosphate glycosyltransferase [Roseobacter fucihabitans]|uniref:D-inositol-3-phosphate glycosyltransferase n=1 Tax=Roseobacter fucihabitans TaxID=1537242 RepID=A0ABZ2C2V0_9RHOB|nr:glycosyltransferase [Roseobacter litoralis]MBC6968250.1 D-inositol 3-phosphate glycosyltransferase [Roseobacter litoralis]